MQRKKHSAELKAKVALEALKGDKSINEIADSREVYTICSPILVMRYTTAHAL